MYMMGSSIALLYVLVRFLPNCCDTFVGVTVELDESGDEIFVVKDSRGTRKLSLAMWMAAWDRYALAAAMVKMLDFAIAMRYKQVCACARV